jgi:hypothetical protein
MDGKYSQYHYVVLKADYVQGFTSTAPVCHEDMVLKGTEATATFT